MSSDDDEIIIRNGTWKRWLNYYVVFGGTKITEPTGQPSYGIDSSYSIAGGLRVKGKYLAIAAALVAFVLGRLTA